MDVLEAIKTRRSIRAFKDKPVDDGLIDELVEAGRLAPSGCNTQPLKLFIVTGKEAKKSLKKAGAFEQEFVYRAPLILVFCGDPEDYGAEDIPSLRGKGAKRCLRDLSIASAFIALRATELGLSCCWVGLIDEQAIKKTLGIQDSYMVPYVICFGYPAEKPKRLERKRKADFIIGRS